MGVDTYKRSGMRVTVILFFLLAGMEGCRMQQEKKEEIPQEEKSMDRPLREEQPRPRTPVKIS